MQNVVKLLLISGCCVVFVACLGGIQGCSNKDVSDRQPQKILQDDPNGVRYVEVDQAKSKWKSVDLDVVDKKSRIRTKYTIPIGSTLEVPGSTLSIKVQVFYPDFIMNGGVASSKSDVLNNPGAKLHVVDNGKDIFNGWLFGRGGSAEPFGKMKYEFYLVGCTPPA